MNKKNHEFSNLIILGELDFFISTRFANDNDNEYKSFSYAPKHLPALQNEDGASNINALYLINNALEAIAEIKSKNNGELQDVCYITIPDKLNKAINTGTYKNWLKTNGMTTTGKQYSEKEMDQWYRFNSLYTNLFSDVNFRPVKYFSMSKPKYMIDNINKNKRLIRLMQQHIEQHKTNILEAMIAAY